MGCLSVFVYSGVWRYLQENTEGSPLSLTINIVISPSRLSAENSCKIRHYEQCNYVDKHSHAVLLCLLRIFACTEKKPHPVAMFLNCLLSGFIGLIVLACSPTLEYDEEIDFKENETLGWIILILCIILFILSVWYGYEAAKDYHARMFWQLHNTIMNR